MTEVVDPNNQQEPAAEKQEVNPIVQEYEGKLAAMVAHQEKLLAEAKQAKAARNELKNQLDSLQQKDKQAKMDRGEFDDLVKLAYKERDEAVARAQQIEQQVRQSKIDNNAMKVANELKARPESAELLSHFISMEIQKLADESGSVSETSLEALKHQFATEAKYQPLLLGNQSSGGRATGATGGAPKNNQMAKADFDKLHPAKQIQLVKDGVTVINN